MSSENKIKQLEEFIGLLDQISYDFMGDITVSRDLRSQITRQKNTVRQIVIEAKAHRTFTIGPPPAIGGLVLKNFDPFEYIFNPPYRHSLVPDLIDMINEAIGNIHAGVFDVVQVNEQIERPAIRSKYAFVAMAIDPGSPELVDVLDTIKIACKELGIDAERVDEQQANERITDRIIESIKVAEFVIVDLTFGRPNVYYEAGFAHGLGKLPIYIARAATKLEFDIKDYPVIFFSNLRELRVGLQVRLKSIAE